MNFTVLGGDLRTVKLIQMLNDINIIYVYGIENTELEGRKNVILCSNIIDAIQESKIVLGPIPLSNDGKNLNAPFSNEAIEVDEIVSELKENQIFMAGKISDELHQKLNEKNIIDVDFMKQEYLTVLNTIATAEGTISIAIESTTKNIQDSNILVLGFGRVAKVVAKKFKNLDANVTCAARKKEDFAWIQTLGYNVCDINLLGENLNKYDIIINTVPEIILTKKELKYINKQSIIIDLASKPGGVNQKDAEEFGIKDIWALALPGKVSPITSAEYIKNTIYSILKDMNQIKMGE